VVVGVGSDRSSTGELDDTDCLDLLGSERRRAVLEQFVAADDRTLSLRSLSTAVARTESDSGVGAIPPDKVRISLHHAHLPKLEDAGVVDYDPDEQTVTYLGSPAVEKWLERIDD